MNSKLQVQEYPFPEKHPYFDIESLEVTELCPENSDVEVDSTLTMIKDLQKIIEECSHLTEQEKLDYCESQRYFIKEYLKKLNRKHDI